MNTSSADFPFCVYESMFYICSLLEADADSLQSLLSGWDNPIFACYPEVGIILHPQLQGGVISVSSSIML